MTFSQNSKNHETFGQNLSNWSVQPIKKPSGFISAKLHQWEWNTASAFTFSMRNIFFSYIRNYLMNDSLEILI